MADTPKKRDKKDFSGSKSFNVPVISSDTSLSRYLQDIQKFPMLTEQEEYVLAKAWKDHGDVDAAHKLVTSHMRLVAKIASGYKGYGFPVMDLISEGNVGLMQAVKKFDPDKGFRLSTYAMWWIKAAIQEYVLRSWSLVKMGTTAAQKKLFFNLRRLKHQIEATESNDLTPEHVEEIAKELDVPEQDVVDMNQRMSGSDYSLNRVVTHDSEDEWQDFLADEDESPEDIIAEDDEMNYKRMLLANAMDDLNERERAIIERRHLQENPDTLEDLSQVYKISRERVRQIEARALEKIQQTVQQQERAN